MASEGGNPETDRWWRLSQLFRSVAPDEGEQRIRIRFMERHTMLPVKAVYFLVLIYYLYFSEHCFAPFNGSFSFASLSTR